jgi:hypothetical protein
MLSLKQEWVKVALGFLVLAFILILFYVLRSLMINKRDDLLAMPAPTPSWIQLMAPQPGSSVEIDETLPVDTRSFWPGLGNLCIQLDMDQVGLSPSQAKEGIHLAIDGLPVRKIRLGRLAHGIIPKRGYFDMVTSPRSDTHFIVCLLMELPLGRHMAKIEVPEKDLSYSWAFDLVEDTKDLHGCFGPPWDFMDTTLPGIWISRGPSGRKDTLIFRDDNTYKQIVEASEYGVEYESDWQHWYYEYWSALHLGYIHLEGMSLCGWAPGEVSCETTGAGKLWWLDTCKEEIYQMPDEEIILHVRHVSPSSGQPTRYILTLPGGQDSMWFYVLEEE